MSGPRPAAVTLFKDTSQGLYWYGSYLCESAAFDAARAKPGLYRMLAVPTGAWLRTIDTRGPEPWPKIRRA
jgi:hypothetical protein